MTGLVSTREGEDLFTRQVHPLQQGAASRGFVRVDLPLEDRSPGIVWNLYGMVTERLILSFRLPE